MMIRAERMDERLIIRIAYIAIEYAHTHTHTYDPMSLEKEGILRGGFFSVEILNTIQHCNN